MKIAFSPAKLILMVSLLALSTACNKQSSSTQSSGDVKQTVGIDETNPLKFTVDDIRRNYTNVQGPRDLPDHVGWSEYQGERNGVIAYFWVKDKAVYSVSISNSQKVESLLSPYSNGHAWTYTGTGRLPIFREWQRDDKEAWCEAVTDKQRGFVDIAIHTKASNRITQSATPVVSATPSDTSHSIPRAIARAEDATTHSQYEDQTSSDDLDLSKSERIVDINTMLMRRMTDYGVYYICMIERKLKPSDFGFSNIYNDRVYQITVIEFADWEYWLRDAAGESVTSTASFGRSDVSVPEIKVQECIFPGKEEATAAFEDAVRKYKPYHDLGFTRSGIDKSGILLTSNARFESSGKAMLLLKIGDTQKVETSDGFAKSVPVFIEQEMIPQKENALVGLWKRLEQAERKAYSHN